MKLKKIKSCKFHFFLAYASPDKEVATALYTHLSQSYEVFLDTSSLLPGEEWGLALPEALRASMLIVVMLSKHTKAAFYQREEIALAIEVTREEPNSHRIIPVYLDSPETCETPYGLAQIQAISFINTGGTDTDSIAHALIDTFNHMAPDYNSTHRRSARRLRQEKRQGQSRPIAKAEPWSTIRSDSEKCLPFGSRRRVRAGVFDVPWTDVADPPIDRIFLEKTLFEIASENRRMVLLYLDVDGMTAINTRYGSSVGNRVLISFFQILGHLAPLPDRVARCGRDEFILCLNSRSLSQAFELSHQILNRVREYPWEQFSPGLFVSVSIGVAERKRLESTTDWIVRAIHGCLMAKKMQPGSVVEGPVALPPEVSRNLRDYGSR